MTSFLTPRTPEVEPLTPKQMDCDVTQNLAFYLRFPTLLTELLEAASEFVTTETLGLFLSKHPLPDRIQLRDLHKELYECCNDLCAEAQNVPGDNPEPATSSEDAQGVPRGDLEPNRDSKLGRNVKEWQEYLKC